MNLPCGTKNSRCFTGAVWTVRYTAKKYNDDPNGYEVFELGIGLIGSMAFTEGDEMLLFGDAGKVWRWTPGGEPTLYRDFGGSLFNDCIVDPRGRIYCGMLANDYQQTAFPTE